MHSRLLFWRGNMEKIDLKDRKILYHLDINSRESFRSIGKKVGLSKDVVASRVKKLEEKGFIFSKDGVALPLMRLTRKGELRRIKGEKNWIYTN